VPDYRVAFIALVSDVPIVTDGDPALLADCAKPHLVGGIVREMGRMAFDTNARVRERLWELRA
jgi:hypothetical protein